MPATAFTTYPPMDALRRPEFPVSARFAVESGPMKVEVAVVVERILPTVSCDEVAAIFVPSKYRMAFVAKAVLLVPPLVMPRVPVTSAVRETV